MDWDEFYMYEVLLDDDDNIPQRNPDRQPNSNDNGCVILFLIAAIILGFILL